MIRVLARLAWQGLYELTLNPWIQIATLGAATLVAFLAGLFLMSLTTLNHQLGMVRGETIFQVYWHTKTDIKQIRAQWQHYPQLPDFQHMHTYTPEEALRELNTRLDRGHGGLEKSFPFLAKKSPLPATALLSFVPRARDIEGWIKETTAYLSSQPGVARVVTTPLRDELGRAWQQISRHVMWPAVSFLTLALGLVVGNTRRLALLAKEQEMEILRIVGAFNWYIRLPLIVSGAVLGLVGGAFALGLLALVHSQVRNAFNFPPLLMEIHFLSPSMAWALVLAPMLTAAFASWLAVRHQ